MYQLLLMFGDHLLSLRLSNTSLLSVCRSLGVHLSKVRSLTLDSWEAEQLKVERTH